MNHFYQSISGWFSFKDLYAEMVAKAPKGELSTFVEVGAWKGKSTAFMGVEIANSRKPISFYTVDHWLGSDEPAHHADPFVQAGKLYEEFRKNVRPLLNVYVHPLRMASVEAAKRFDDGSVDFLFLDGGHDYDSVRDDLTAWLPKLKANAVLAGDDYNWTGVKKAIFERFGEDRIAVLGENKGRHWKVK